MFCPKCGSNQSEGKRFCTVCGTNLQVVTQALSGQLPQTYYQPQIPHPYEIERQRETAKGLRLAIIGGGFVALKFFSVIFSGGSLIHPLFIIGFILLAVGVSKLVAYRPTQTAPPQSPASHSYPSPVPSPEIIQVSPQPVFASAPRTSELPPIEQTVPSVTEDDTKHLPQYVPPQKLQR
jgi:hypothetical protein